MITTNSVFGVATIYYPPRDCGFKDKAVTDYLIDSCEQVILCDPNMKIITLGDINKLNFQELLS